jgi:hypothetical protein
VIFPSPTILYVAAAATVSAAVVGFTSGYAIRDNIAKAQAADALRKAQQQQDLLVKAINDTSSAYEQLKAQLDAKRVSDAPAIYGAYKGAPAPANCAPPPAVVGLLHSRIADANAAASGKPSQPVSKPAGSARPVSRP